VRFLLFRLFVFVIFIFRNLLSRTRLTTNITGGNPSHLLLPHASLVEFVMASLSPSSSSSVFYHKYAIIRPFLIPVAVLLGRSSFLLHHPRQRSHLSLDFILVFISQFFQTAWPSRILLDVFKIFFFVSQPQ
jgi:hypothetical protein